MLAPAAVLGNQTPTFQLAPPCASNAAGEVIDFMDQLGRPQDPWQQTTLRLWLGERLDGIWAAFLLFLFLQRQNGKGDPLLARQMGGLFLFGERRIIYTAHKGETVKAAWSRCLEVVEAHDDLTRRLRRINQKDGEEGLELMSGAELQFKIRSGGGKGRGLTGNCIQVDEALYLGQDALDAFGPTTLAVDNAQVILASTPPERADAPLMGIRARAHAGEPRMAGAEWANPAGANLEDPVVMARVNPMLGRRITWERLGDLAVLLGEAGYARECGGIWPDPASGKALDVQQWVRLHDPGSERAGDVALGVEIGPGREWAAIGLAGPRADGLGHVRLSDHRQGVRWLVPRLVELVVALDPVAIGMSAAAARSLAPQLREVGISAPEQADAPERGDLAVMGPADAAAACAQLIDAVRGGDFRVVPDDALLQAVKGAETRQVGDALTWVARDGTSEATPLGAVTRAVWAYAQRAPLVVDTDYDIGQSVY